MFGNVVLIQRNNVSLYFKNAIKVFIDRKIADNLRHPAYNHKLSEQPLKPFMHTQGNGLLGLRIIFQFADCFFTVTIGPQKLLKIQRMHRELVLISHRKRCRHFYRIIRVLPISKTKQRPGSNHIKPHIFCKKLQCRSGIAATLNLVQKEKRIAGNQTNIRNVSRYALVDFLCRQVPVKNSFQPAIPIKINLDKGRILSLSKRSHKIRLSDLPCSKQQKALP